MYQNTDNITNAIWKKKNNNNQSNQSGINNNALEDGQHHNNNHNLINLDNLRGDGEKIKR